MLADLRDQAAVAAVASEGFDGVLHFAALALVSESSPIRNAITARTSAER